MSEAAGEQSADAAAAATRSRDAPRNGKHRHLVWLGLFAGTLLFVIGVRFLIVPESAQRTFGLPRDLAGAELHYVVALRDLWLGALAVLLAWWRQWRGLALWMLLAVPVCWGDAAIVGLAGGHPAAIAFHIGSGLFCLLVGLAVWRLRDGA